MFTTIRRYHVKQPGQIDEIIRRIESGLVPIIAAQAGFQSYAAIDAGDGQEISISVYADRAAADAANRAAAAWVKDNLATVLGPADVTVGERIVAASLEEQNVKVVQQGYAAFGRGDIPGLLALLDPKVSWITPGPADLPTAGTRTGHAAVTEFFQALAAVGDIVRFEPRQFTAQGDRVIVTGDDTTRVKATGKSLEFRWTHVFTVRQGKVVAFEEYGDMSPLVAEIRSAQSRV
ncbi:MAG TPA: nuclear transport factor 2 family protein [Vicinamibacterales bacterium]|jgi:hypothetical protein|nr:nuclear transport factor 2 family protein [Vicinamibacterales bacterium]